MRSLEPVDRSPEGWPWRGQGGVMRRLRGPRGEASTVGWAKVATAEEVVTAGAATDEAAGAATGAATAAIGLATAAADVAVAVGLAAAAVGLAAAAAGLAAGGP